MKSIIEPKIHETWKTQLFSEFQKDYFHNLKQFLLNEKKTYVIYPHSSLIFNAFDNTPFENLKVVILGQDPYHGRGQAHGLSFSVPDGIAKPPSLINIFKELNDDIGCPIPATGNLTKWAKQGVLLLNAILTVRDNQAGSHQKKGWEIFTDSIIRLISDKKENVVFLLWGNYAREKTKLINSSKHYVLEAAHPSPFSVNNGFFGCKHFSKCNLYLEKNNIEKINWEI